MIEVYCFSKREKLQNKNWPSAFTCRPLEGDWVKATDGTLGRIISICHAPGHLGGLVLEVELY
jgi:hypothetical protein